MTKATIVPSDAALLADFTAKTADQLDSQATAYFDRLHWAPVVGNAAAIISIAGLVGNVADPDAALRALTPSLVFFSSGLFAGMLSTSFQSGGLSAAAKTTTTIAQLVATGNALSAASKKLRTKPPPATPEAKDKVLAKADEYVARLQKVADDLEAARRDLKRATRALNVATALNGASVGICGTGLAILIFGHASGQMVLQPRAHDALMEQGVKENSQLSPNRPEQVQKRDAK